jgi:hypothetical protein
MSGEESKKPNDPTKNVIAVSLNDMVSKVMENADQETRNLIQTLLK